MFEIPETINIHFCTSIYDLINIITITIDDDSFRHRILKKTIQKYERLCNIATPLIVYEMHLAHPLVLLFLETRHAIRSRTPNVYINK